MHIAGAKKGFTKSQIEYQLTNVGEGSKGLFVHKFPSSALASGQ